MNSVKIASLKAHLSRYLRVVRAGQVVTVFDRNAPVARLVPVDTTDDFVITMPAPNAQPIGRIKLPRRSRKPAGPDIVCLLMEDRGRRCR
jgi:prevent-host-death family protein